jgi:membrane-associated protein
MDWISSVVDLFLHLDKHLAEVLREYGTWTYIILFAIIFCETGFVLTPILPGDSLLFAAGIFAAKGDLDVNLLFVILAVAAILGDSINYLVGAYIGPRAFSGKLPLLNQKHLERTREFYEKHGGKTIILARFIPIVRTFAPFVAGVGAMNYRRFLAYNAIGGFFWVAGFLYLGYFFGNVSIVKENFSLAVVAIIFVSVLPIAYELNAARSTRKAQSVGKVGASE